VLLPRNEPAGDTVRRLWDRIAAAKELAGYSGTAWHGVVVRIVVDENAAAGSPVPVRLSLAPRQLAFRKGEEIARVSLDGQHSEGELLRKLVGLLQGPVRGRALRRSMLPATDGRVGELQYDPLLETVNKVRQISGPARIGVVAATDVWSEGPLRIDFYVLPGDPRVADEP
jgi:uncharacterized protein (DUF3084 family)